MTTDSVQEEIVALIADATGLDTEDIRPENHFYEDLEIDSIKAIEITVAIEKKFRISVRDEDVPKITTVQEAVRMVRQLLDEKKTSAA